MKKNRPSRGNWCRICVMNVVKQEGSNGWVSAQWRRVCRGCAADVIGVRELSGGGSTAEGG